MNVERWPDSRASIAFLDFEASGLGPYSWPIEVGWSVNGGQPKSVLIRPEPSWSMDSWDEQAERVHGIEMSDLQDHGLSPADVCEQLDAELAGLSVYTDAPEFDGYWLAVLYAALERQPTFRLLYMDELLASFCDSLRIFLAKTRAKAIAPPTHRAAEDVRYLNELYRQCLEAN